jgi:hypothetical protein
LIDNIHSKQHENIHRCFTHHNYNTLDTLQDKNILDTDRHLTKAGLIPLRLFELYKNASEHFLVNRMRIARTSDGKWIFLVPVDEQWECFALEPVFCMSLILSTFPFLRQGQDRNAEAGLPSPYTDDRKKELAKTVQQELAIKTFTNRKLTSACQYSFTGEKCFLIDCLKQEITEILPRDARVQIMKMLEIKDEGGKEHGS